MDLVNKTKKQSRKKPLKRSKSGFEIEAHVIDKKGNISYQGYSLFKELKERNPEMIVEKECGMSMIELGCYPDINTFNPALQIISTMDKIIKEAKKKGLLLYPFGTYPGRYEGKFTPDPSGKYKIQENIFTKEKFALATKVVGFHHHYTLPKGVFDSEKKELKVLFDSKIKRSLMSSYNFEIAIDPILTVLTQSSPFYDGQFLAKDSRMLIYRGGRKLNHSGMYNNLQQFGALPPYKQTLLDLLSSLKRRKEKWKKVIKKADNNAKFEEIYPFALDICWNPVKINKHGTLEQRGMSMNYLSIVMGLSAMIKFCLRKIQREFIEVVATDVGVNNAFKIENGIMHIPPHTYVRNNLQKISAYEGLANEELYQYTKRFVRMAKALMPDYYYPLIARIESMVKNRKTVSDEIITYAKNKKMITKKNTVSDTNARKIALYFAKKFNRDLKDTKKIIKEIIKKHKEDTS
jgi:hypothetical protein